MLMTQASSCQLQPEPVEELRPAGEERVIYFSFFVPQSLKPLFAKPNSKANRRVGKIESDCSCLFRLSPIKACGSGSELCQIVEAFLDQQSGDFDKCLAMLRSLLASAGREFQLYRTINLSTLPDGGYDYKCYYATSDKLECDGSDGKKAEPAREEEPSVSMALSVAQSDSALSSVSTASSTVSQLGSSMGSRKSRESLAAFVSLEDSLGHLEGIVDSNCSSVIQSVFLEVLKQELGPAIWQHCLHQVGTELTRSVTRQLLVNSCMLSLVAAASVDDLLDSTVLCTEICSGIFKNCGTDACSGSAAQSDLSVVSSIFDGSLSEDVKSEANPTPDGDSNSLFSVSELVFDSGGGVKTDCIRLTPQPAPRIRSRTKRRAIGGLLEPMLDYCCSLSAEEACLEVLVEYVSRRLVLSLHQSSCSENQFECRVFKTLARFNSMLRMAESEPDLAGVVEKFFSCVSESIASPDAISTSQVVAALQTQPANRVCGDQTDRVGWEPVLTMRTAFERTVSKQIAKLNGKTRRYQDGSSEADYTVPKKLNEVFREACDDTLAEPDSLPSEAFEFAFQTREASSSTRIRSSQLRSEEICFEEAGSTVIELDSSSADLIQAAGRLHSGLVCGIGPINMSIAVWQPDQPIRCETEANVGLPDKDALTLTTASIGFASLASVGCAVVSTTRAVVSESGPGLHACCAMSQFASASALAIQSFASPMLTVAEFQPAIVDTADRLSRSVCMHPPRQAFEVRVPRCNCDSPPATICREFSSSTRSPIGLLSYAGSSCATIRAPAAACAVQTRVRTCRSHCRPLSQLVLCSPESAKRIEFSGSCNLATGGLELAPVSTCRLETVKLLSAISEPSDTSSMRSTSTAALQRLSGGVERAESSWRLRVPESALAIAAAVRAAPACSSGGQLDEYGWATASACLRPALAEFTSAPLSQPAVAMRSAESFSNAAGCIGQLADATAISDASNSVSAVECSFFSVCRTELDCVTAASNSPALQTPCPVLRCSQIDGHDAETESTTVTAVAASAALIAVNSMKSESLVFVPEDFSSSSSSSRSQRLQRLRVQLQWLGQCDIDAVAESDTRRLLQLLAHSKQLLDRVLAGEVVHGFL